MFKKTSIVLMVLISIALIGIVNAETISDNTTVVTGTTVAKDVNASETVVAKTPVSETNATETTVAPTEIVTTVVTGTPAPNESIVNETPVIIPLDVNATIVNATEPEVNISTPVPETKPRATGTLHVIDRSLQMFLKKDIFVQEVVPGTVTFTNGCIVGKGVVDKFTTIGEPTKYTLNMNGENDIVVPAGTYSVEIVGYNGGQLPVYALADIKEGYLTNVIYL